jgi:hypothetical protein
MERQVKITTVILNVRSAVQIDAGVVLPPGQYVGLCRQTGVRNLAGGTSAAQPEYLMRFTADQLASMGARNVQNHISIEYDLTKFVRSGEISI